MSLYGYNFFGSPYVSKFGDWAFMLKSEERKLKFSEIPSETDILITHGPPRNILDGDENLDKDDLKRYGCPFLNSQVFDRVKPMFHVFGHIHEGYGQQKISDV